MRDTDLRELFERVGASPSDRQIAQLRAFAISTQHSLRRFAERLAEVVSAACAKSTVEHAKVRDRLRELGRWRTVCFSGRGGERPTIGGAWQTITRDEIKEIFRRREADVMLCTDAAAEGLNFQFCGALVNYDMPWNPMRAEQRIGRIDRLGQSYDKIRIVNFHYEDTVETDVYRALRARIGLFSRFVGRLQPILATLPRSLAESY